MSVRLPNQLLANDTAFARFFVHNNLVTINGQKMGKSLGNSIDLQTLLSKYNPDVLRLYLLQNHYRSVLDFTDQGLEETQKTYSKFISFIKQTEDISQDNLNMSYSDIAELKEKFLEAMDDDLNTALALSHLLQMLKIGNATDDNNKKCYIKEILVDLIENIFGLRLEVNISSSKEDEVINILIKLRDKFKKEGNYEMSDLIRDELKNINIKLNDSREGTTYKIEQ